MHWLAGAMAGLLADVVVHPIDLIRARLQTQSVASASTAPSTTTSPKNAIAYRSATHAFRVILRDEGPRGLYKGFAAVAVGTVPGHALYFATYELSKRLLWPVAAQKYHTLSVHANENDADTDTKNNQEIELPFWRRAGVHLAAGFIADAAGSLAWTPMDVIKQRMQIQRDSAIKSSSDTTLYRSSVHAFRVILRDEGLRGLYRGFWAGLMTFGPYVSLYFMLYEQFKYALLRTDTRSIPILNGVGGVANPWLGRAESELPFYTFLVGAGVSGGISAVLTCPLDVVKTRMQVQQRKLSHLAPSLSTASSTAAGTTNTTVYYRNWAHAFRSIYTTEGPRAFMQGVRPRALWMSLGTALTMMIYEEVKKVLPHTD